MTILDQTEMILPNPSCSRRSRHDTGYRPPDLTLEAPATTGLSATERFQPRSDRFQTGILSPSRPSDEASPITKGVESPIRTESRFAAREPFAFAES